MLANEVLDALPVHRVEQVAGRLRERHVDHRDGRLVEVRGDPSTPALAARLAGEAVALRDGQLAEISLAIEPWIRDAAAGLERGLLLLVDYGYPAAELYGPRRLAGTLAAYVNHRVHDDPLVNVGRQDLTVHVDVTAVDRAALGAGLDRLGSTTQAEFLVGLGLEAMLDEARAESAETFEGRRAAGGVMRLLDPAATGGFKVLGYGRGIAADPVAGVLVRAAGAGHGTPRIDGELAGGARLDRARSDADQGWSLPGRDLSGGPGGKGAGADRVERLARRAPARCGRSVVVEGSIPVEQLRAP